jgi:hypothetical protein
MWFFTPTKERRISSRVRPAAIIFLIALIRRTEATG